jgi:hypothetical protein
VWNYQISKFYFHLINKKNGLATPELELSQMGQTEIKKTVVL